MKDVDGYITISPVVCVGGGGCKRMDGDTRNKYVTIKRLKWQQIMILVFCRGGRRRARQKSDTVQLLHQQMIRKGRQLNLR
jgi:hypothetical protein